MECDFCSSPDVVTRYQCMDFDSESKDAGVMMGFASDPRPHNVILASRNFWAACAPCAELVDAEKIDELVERVVEILGFDNPLAELGFRIHIRKTYKLFFANRIRISGTTEYPL